MKQKSEWLETTWGKWENNLNWNSLFSLRITGCDNIHKKVSASCRRVCDAIQKD